MHRRTFLRDTGFIAGISLVPGSVFPMFDLAKSTSTSNLSLTVSFCMQQVQIQLAHANTARPEWERILQSSLRRAAPGNTFLAGKYGLTSLSDTLYQLSSAYTDFQSKPNSPDTREYLSYSLGNYAANLIKSNFERERLESWISEIEKSALLDALVISHFFLKNQDLSSLSESDIATMLHTMTTRTVIKFHTLKATDGMPMEWIEGMISLFESLRVYFDKVASNLKKGNLSTVPNNVFDPNDKLLGSLSPTKNSIGIDSSLYGNFIGVPTAFCVISKAILHSCKSILDYHPENRR